MHEKGGNLADIMGLSNTATLIKYYAVILKPTVAKEMKKLSLNFGS